MEALYHSYRYSYIQRSVIDLDTVPPCLHGCSALTHARTLMAELVYYAPSAEKCMNVPAR